MLIDDEWSISLTVFRWLKDVDNVNEPARAGLPSLTWRSSTYPSTHTVDAASNLTNRTILFSLSVSKPRFYLVEWECFSVAQWES